jgi:hypothetical protein
MTKRYSFNIIAKVLLLSVLICFCGESVLAQRNKKNDKDDKKEYPKRVKIWKLSQDYSQEEYTLDTDTSLHLFQLYDYNDKGSISYSNLGNMGTPYIYNIFDDRELRKNNEVFFFDRINDFISKPENTKFYQVNHPYTWLYYATTPKSRNGQIIDFTHTQNVTKNFNWGFNIGLVGSTGRISHQHSRNTTFSPQMSYNGKHLSVHFFYNFTKSYIEENGGIVDTVEVNAKRFTTKMSKPFSNWGKRTWNLVAEYSIGKTDFQIINDSTRNEIYTPKLTFGYVFKHDKMFRTYEDEDMNKDMYQNFYHGTTATYDSLYFRRLTNQFHLKIAENQLLGISPGIFGSIGMENDIYYNFQNYHSSTNSSNYSNTYFEGGISKNKSKNLFLHGNYKQYLSGYKLGDFNVNGSLGLKFYKGETDTVKYYLKASVDFYNKEPNYFEKYYYSNNFRWDNNFNKTQTTRIGGEFSIPKWHFKIGASHYLLNNYIYFNSNAVTAQAKSAISVMSVSLMKDFYIWHARFANRVTWQSTNHNEILNLPDIALYHSTYFEFYLVKNVLLTQLGGEVSYSTEYDAFGYMPSTSAFYPLKHSKAGEYPLLNGFANIKIRGVLMFFKWENIGNGLIRDWYYSTDNYPYQDFHFMFGILWRFGD